MNFRRASLLTVLLVWPLIAAAQNEPIDERAKKILEEMSDLLAQSPAFAFRTEQTLDEVLDSGLKAQFASSRTVAVSKPSRAAGHADGDLLSTTFWLDGETMTFLDERHFRYVQIEVPETLDAALDFLAEEYEVVMPQADEEMPSRCPRERVARVADLGGRRGRAPASQNPH